MVRFGVLVLRTILVSALFHMAPEKLPGHKTNFASAFLSVADSLISALFYHGFGKTVREDIIARTPINVASVTPL